MQQCSYRAVGPIQSMTRVQSRSVRISVGISEWRIARDPQSRSGTVTYNPIRKVRRFLIRNPISELWQWSLRRSFYSTLLGNDKRLFSAFLIQVTLPAKCGLPPGWRWVAKLAYSCLLTMQVMWPEPSRDLASQYDRKFFTAAFF